MAEEEWKLGQACNGKHLLLELYRNSQKVKPEIRGTKCAPIQKQAGMSLVNIFCSRDRCPVLRGDNDHALAEQTKFVIKNGNQLNRNLSTLTVEFKHHTVLQANGIVEVVGGMIDAFYTLPQVLRGKLPRNGPNYKIL